jgi:hypothetical protein
MASTDWRHMTDLVYASGEGRRADQGGSPTTHYAEGNAIVPAHPYPRNQTWPNQLAALSLEVLAREAARTAASAPHPKSAKEMEDDEEEKASCSHGSGRTFFFKWHHQNVTLSAEPRQSPVAQPVQPEWRPPSG